MSSANLNELPEPDEHAQAHSEQLQALIKQAIDAQGGAIPFGQFMQMALYHPGLGYYVAGARKFGEAGDFITAPEISPLFSRCLARQAKQVLGEIGHGDILEFGAGTGAGAPCVRRRPRRAIIRTRTVMPSQMWALPSRKAAVSGVWPSLRAWP